MCFNTCWWSLQSAGINLKESGQTSFPNGNIIIRNEPESPQHIVLVTKYRVTPNASFHLLRNTKADYTVLGKLSLKTVDTANSMWCYKLASSIVKWNMAICLICTIIIM